jgi:hypothetical protein
MKTKEKMLKSKIGEEYKNFLEEKLFLLEFRLRRNTKIVKEQIMVVLSYILNEKPTLPLTGDLIPKGVKSTINVGGDYNSVWKHIHNTRKELYFK